MHSAMLDEIKQILNRYEYRCAEIYEESGDVIALAEGVEPPRFNKQDATYMEHIGSDCLRVINCFLMRNNQPVYQLKCRCHNYRLIKALPQIIHDSKLGETELFFGKHKGKKLKDVPVDYLVWCEKTLGKKTITDRISRFLKGLNENRSHNADG